MDGMDRTDRMEKAKKKYKRKKRMIILVPAIVAIIIAALNLNSQSFRRWLKSMWSDYTGGLPRTVEVYDENGKIIKKWEGMVDLEENDYGNKVMFDLNGKRKTIYNAAVIVEEK